MLLPTLARQEDDTNNRHPSSTRLHSVYDVTPSRSSINDDFIVILVPLLVDDPPNRLVCGKKALTPHTAKDHLGLFLAFANDLFAANPQSVGGSLKKKKDIRLASSEEGVT